MDDIVLKGPFRLSQRLFHCQDIAGPGRYDNKDFANWSQRAARLEERVVALEAGRDRLREALEQTRNTLWPFLEAVVRTPPSPSILLGLCNLINSALAEEREEAKAIEKEAE